MLALFFFNIIMWPFSFQYFQIMFFSFLALKKSVKKIIKMVCLFFNNTKLFNIQLNFYLDVSHYFSAGESVSVSPKNACTFLPQHNNVAIFFSIFPNNVLQFPRSKKIG